jgi:myo-inositol 2-dehydrogenase/D-chiro-inositol 1-dehydrogenase
VDRGARRSGTAVPPGTACAGASPHPCEGRDALRALLVAEACEISRRERRPVTLAEVDAAARALTGTDGAVT